MPYGFGKHIVCQNNDEAKSGEDERNLAREEKAVNLYDEEALENGAPCKHGRDCDSNHFTNTAAGYSYLIGGLVKFSIFTAIVIFLAFVFYFLLFP